MAGCQETIHHSGKKSATEQGVVETESVFRVYPENGALRNETCYDMVRRVIYTRLNRQSIIRRATVSSEIVAIGHCVCSASFVDTFGYQTVLVVSHFTSMCQIMD